MIAVDTNVLVHAHRRDAQFHSRARHVVSSLAESSAPWAIPWPCVHEFYSAATNVRGYKPASTADDAASQLEAWFASPSLVLLHESAQHWTTLRRLLLDARVAGGLVHDARVAAICLDHDVSELWSADRDFNRFPRLSVRNRLVS